MNASITYWRKLLRGSRSGTLIGGAGVMDFLLGSYTGIEVSQFGKSEEKWWCSDHPELICACLLA